MPDQLAIWLYGRKVAVVEQPRPRTMRLAYTAEAIEHFTLGTPLLSLNLPLVTTSYANGVTTAFLDGLLPEGGTRDSMAAKLELVASDTFGLIRELGRECAGAIVVLPDDGSIPTADTVHTATPLTDEEVATLIEGLEANPLGVDVNADIRMSLAGVQDKLLLVRPADGTWARPTNGAPSTHILKPEIGQYPDTVQNEAFCMRVAKHAGVDVANVEIVQIAGKSVLAVQRYDRLVAHDGSVRRIHQEDFCQVLGILPDKKYEAEGGPSLRQIASVLSTASADRDPLRKLLEAATLNLVFGNADAHGKNFSLLHSEAGQLHLAPLYDLVCTLLYPPLTTKLAMHVDSIQLMERVTTDRLLNEAVSWGLRRDAAETIVHELLERLPAAIEAASREIEALPAALPKLITARYELFKRT